jgi:hypothetical protein
MIGILDSNYDGSLPYLEPRSAVMPLRVLYEGRPLAGGLVKLTDLDHDDALIETHLTDAAGRANFTMHGAGSSLLNIVWTNLCAHRKEIVELRLAVSMSSARSSRLLMCSAPVLACLDARGEQYRSCNWY